MNHTCSKCEINFTTLAHLRKHAIKFHPKIALEIAPLRYRKNTPLSGFSCNICQKTFNHRQSVRRHLKTHDISTLSGASDTSQPSQEQNQKTTRYSKKCPLCGYNGAHKKDTLDHFKNVHEISFYSSNLTFDTIEEFHQWKTEIETTTNTRFVKKRSGSYKSHITANYVCHRSGNYLPEGKGERRIKTQGSNKINGFCPANIQMHTENNKNIKVQYLETHIGHETDIGHLQLTASERQNLAEKIAAKVPFDDILDEIRNSVTDFSLKRIHLLTKKDLFNIENSFNLTHSSVRHSNDANDVESWVLEMQRDCVIFYKPQGVALETQPQLKDGDFVLIMMTPAQCELLKKYGSNCICVDTYDLTNSHFELHTLLIIDAIGEGFPCAFLLSNRCDTDVMSLFFNQIKIKAGFISPKIFMSGLAESSFNAWLQVMGVPEKRLFCTWHVDRAWREKLSKIKTKDKQVLIYKTLRTLLQETGPMTFERMLEQHCSNMSDPDTRDFVVYFKDNYQKTSEHWADCYRSQSELNANMHFERMHRTIKYICLGGKKVKRLDKGIAALMRFIRNRLIDRLIVINKGKMSGQIKNIRMRHKDLNDLNQCSITRTEHGWELPSSTGNQIYFIQEVKDSCTCQLRCSECDICIHRYCCTCFDSAIKFNMCKHIHLLAQHRKETGNFENTTTASDGIKIDVKEDHDEPYIQPDEVNDELDVILSELTEKQKPNVSLIEDRQSRIMGNFQQILYSSTSHKNLDIIEKMVNSLPPALAASEYVDELIIP